MSRNLQKITPLQVELVAPREQLGFFDQQSMTLPKEMTPLEVWTEMMADPLPFMATAFKIRDAIAARFGVKRIGGFSGKEPGFIQVGDKLDFFLVETLSDTVMSLSERDKHLDVLTCVTCTENTLMITSSVKVHNWFGRLYMLPVAPAHRLIVRVMLGRFRRKLADAA
ncbi:DUF2867 domain-containing protein [Sulfitobacter donghicola]|uniref:DUF2867 domain-containing protein n=1 Tax=Sulfitobacter donghicola DSW-25 = KCTC 12864 = JCM 14565 TaxID=1300350 RepID=A0A073IN33_9RHOB|nr:DUF2867 domain-containing protein [Sulfitobacter donghicola]KEJ90975.1 hypothetical protein DSW25_03520 [Sulfitobacter donghicola DSW-25 = KCTC 12864 = JCM 14565]KIN68269.1 DUF2867 domain containing protein [Sulfitobacter donghicola DSW-25 = KCTC 12864 = JCM 14565]